MTELPRGETLQALQRDVEDFQQSCPEPKDWGARERSDANDLLTRVCRLGGVRASAPPRPPLQRSVSGPHQVLALAANGR